MTHKTVYHWNGINHTHATHNPLPMSYNHSHAYKDTTNKGCTQAYMHTSTQQTNGAHKPTHTYKHYTP